MLSQEISSPLGAELTNGAEKLLGITLTLLPAQALKLMKHTKLYFLLLFKGKAL